MPRAVPPLFSTFLSPNEKGSEAGLKFDMVFCVFSVSLSFLMFRLGRLLVLNFSFVASAI